MCTHATHKSATRTLASIQVTLASTQAHMHAYALSYHTTIIFTFSQTSAHFLHVQVPDEATLPSEMRKIGVTPTMQATPEARMVKEEKKKKTQRKMRNVQNTHIEGADFSKDYSET